MIYRKYTDYGRRIDIDIGETYCPECQGRGSKFATISTGVYRQVIRTPCGYCQGYGKTDWIQNATGEPKVGPPIMDFNYLQNQFVEHAAECLRKEIDQRILDSLITFGRVANRIFYEMMKNLAKNAGVAVVTAKQSQAMDLFKCVPDVTERVISIGSKKQKELKPTSDTSLHIQVIKARQS